MNALKKFLIILIFVIKVPEQLFAQNSKLLMDRISDKNLQLDTAATFKRKNGKIDSLNYHYIYWLRYYGDFKDRKPFYDHTFSDSLFPEKVSLKKHAKKSYGYDITTLISRKNGEYIGSSNGWGQTDDELLDLLVKKQFDYLFYIELSNSRYLFGLKNDNVFVIDTYSKPIIITPIREFLDCCWNNFIPVLDKVKK